MTRSRVSLYLSLLTLPLVGCVPTEGDEEDPGEHACEHVTEAGAAVTAAATREESGDAAIDISEEPYTIALVSGEEGWISIDVSGAEEPSLLFIDTADVVTGLFHNDEEDDELSAGSPNEFCVDDIPEHFDLDLHEGTWHLRLGPAAVDSVWLSLLSAEDHAHDE